MSKKIYDINFYDLHNKDKNVKDLVEYMINRTMSMFKWNNLPKSIPQRSLELYLQTQGFVLLTKHNDELCIYYGGLGGEPDYLYRPTIATIANPAQRWDAQLPIAWEVDENTPENAAVIGLNDPLLKGLIPINQKYASQLAENELTLWLTDILCRMPWLLSAQDDRTKASAEQMLNNIFEGKLGVVTDAAFLEGVKEHLLSTHQHQSLGALMQLHQYYKASWFNELGLNAMQNQFKKEAISDSEQQMNTDTLTPFIDIMLKCRQDFCDNVNALYGTDISVELDSAWEDNELEEEALVEGGTEDDNEDNSTYDSDTDEPTDDTDNATDTDTSVSDDNSNMDSSDDIERTEETDETTEETETSETVEEKLEDIQETVENIEEVLDKYVEDTEESESEDKEDE